MYLFFVRQFNDIDHITPIIWKMKSDHHPVAVYCLDPAYDIQNDYRLCFLKRQGVSVSYVYDQCAQEAGRAHQALRWISKHCFSISNRLRHGAWLILSPVADYLGRQFAAIGKKCFGLARKKYYDAAWAGAILKKAAARALCFDHINPGRYTVKALIDAAKALSIPTLALPHGVFIYTNRQVRIGTTQESRLDKFNCFDFVLTQNQLRKEVLIGAGVAEAKVHVMGSARYFEEWMQQNRKILPRKFNPHTAASGKLKAVFMTTRFAYRIDVDRMLKTFELLSKLPGITLLVKPHTRTGKEAVVYEKLPLASVADISSVELCEWADIVLVIASSILIEPLKLNKPVLYLKYLHDNTTQYEEMGACWTIGDEQQLLDAIQALQAHPTKVPYTQEKVDAFLAEIIYGGAEKHDVLAAYERFIINSGNGLN